MIRAFEVIVTQHYTQKCEKAKSTRPTQDAKRRKGGWGLLRISAGFRGKEGEVQWLSGQGNELKQGGVGALSAWTSVTLESVFIVVINLIKFFFDEFQFFHPHYRFHPFSSLRNPSSHQVPFHILCV